MRTAISTLGLVLASLLGCLTTSAQAESWKLISVGIGETAFVAVAVHSTVPEKIVVATRRAVYESLDSGQHWEERFRLPAEVTITGLALAPAAPAVLLATDHGLYGSFDGGATWARVSHRIGKEETRCTHIAFHPLHTGTALLGTRGGLFLSRDHGRHWTVVTIPASARHVAHFAFDPVDPDRLYLVADDGLFIGNLTQGQWQQRVSTLQGESDEGVDLTEEESVNLPEEEPLRRLSAIAVDPRNPSHLYLAGSRGVRCSTDGGIAWHWLTRTGLASAAISRLLLHTHSPLVIYAATARGVARYQPGRERWDTITEGLAASPVNDLAATSAQMWAATEQGLYRYETPLEFAQTEPPSARELLANFVHEPTIRQVQETAIRYAEVHPDKITRWRRQAALKALLPSLDLGMDQDTSRDLHIDEGSFPNFQLINTKDRDAGFDVSVKWDLGNLIWSTDQTSIDVRSKLMVQLRDDIVDEVTRTYFERRRLQVLLLTNPPSEQQATVEKELRLQELTAMLDGLTGGSFSQQLRIEDH